MGAGKSIDLLKTAFNYEEGHKKVLLFTSAVDTRFGHGVIASRIGLKRNAIALTDGDNIYNIFLERNASMFYDCVLIDEAQFLTEEQVKQLRKIVNDFDIPVLCYGIKNDFLNNFFPGSSALLRYADNIEELKTICRFCERKATMVVRIENGVPVYIGDQVKVGGNESYIPVCARCYDAPNLALIKKEMDKNVAKYE